MRTFFLKVGTEIGPTDVPIAPRQEDFDKIFILRLHTDNPVCCRQNSLYKTGAYVPIQEMTASRLSALIEEVLSNPEYRQNTDNMKQVIAETNGLEKAVDLLELAFNLA